MADLARWISFQFGAHGVAATGSPVLAARDRCARCTSPGIWPTTTGPAHGGSRGTPRAETASRGSSTPAGCPASLAPCASILGNRSVPWCCSTAPRPAPRSPSISRPWPADWFGQHRGDRGAPADASAIPAAVRRLRAARFAWVDAAGGVARRTVGRDNAGLTGLASTPHPDRRS